MYGEYQSIYFMSKFFFLSCSLRNNMEKYCTAGEATDDNMAHARFCAEYLKLQKHTHNTQYLMLIHCDSGCKVPHRYPIRLVLLTASHNEFYTQRDMTRTFSYRHWVTRRPYCLVQHKGDAACCRWLPCVWVLPEVLLLECHVHV